MAERWIHGWGWKFKDSIPEKRPGIYRIRCTATGKDYIGESGNVYERFEKGYCHDNPIKDDMDQLGRSIFKIEVLCYFDRDDWIERAALETFYIELYDTMEPRGYNRILSMRGTKGTKVAERISKTLAKLWEDPLYRESMVAAREAPEVRRRTNQNLKVAWARNYEARIAKMQSEEVQAKRLESMAEFWSDPAARAKHGIRMRLAWENPERHAYASATAKAFASTPKGRAAKSRASKGRIWIRNETEERTIHPSEPVPEGWRYGRRPDAKPRRKPGGGIYRFIHDGSVSKKWPINESLPEGWFEGRITKSDISVALAKVAGSSWITDGSVSRRHPAGEPMPEGWRPGRANTANLGPKPGTMRWVHRGNERKMIAIDEPTPKGWTDGKGPHTMA